MRNEALRDKAYLLTSRFRPSHATAGTVPAGKLDIAFAWVGGMTVAEVRTGAMGGAVFSSCSE